MREGLPFVPASEAADRPNVMVDGAALPSTTLTLSHWPGSATPKSLRHDLSAGIAFRYLRSRRRWPAAEVVTLDHFDQDGLVSAFALVDPRRALETERMLMEVAAAGDFDVTADRQAARVAFALRALGPGRDYRAAVELLPDLVARPDSHRNLWEDEDVELTRSEEAFTSGRVRLSEVDALDLAVVEVDPGATGVTAKGGAAAIHPMSVHNRTVRTRVLVLSPPRPQLYFRYETWVTLVSRRVAPRVDLSRLAAELTAAEPGGGRWAFNGIRATVARLEPDGSGSDLAPDSVRTRVERALAHAA